MYDITGFEDLSRPEKELNEMARDGEHLAHRGPDDLGAWWTEAGIALGTGVFPLLTYLSRASAHDIKH